MSRRAPIGLGSRSPVLAPDGGRVTHRRRAPRPAVAETTWSNRDGSSRVVLRNADGSSGVRVRASAAVVGPHLTAVGAALLGGGLGTLMLGSFLLVARARSRAVAEAGNSDLTAAGREETPDG